jgi:hypothetical protein
MQKTVRLLGNIAGVLIRHMARLNEANRPHPMRALTSVCVQIQTAATERSESYQRTEINRET